MKPLRMCTVCRKRFEKKDLIRVVRTPDGAVPDLNGTLPGRGAYLCKSWDCLLAAQKRRVLERAFSGKIDAEVYAKLREIGEETDEH